MTQYGIKDYTSHTTTENCCLHKKIVAVVMESYSVSGQKFDSYSFGSLSAVVWENIQLNNHSVAKLALQKGCCAGPKGP